MTSAKFEIILFLIGIGFGPTAPLTQVALQNTVPIHDLGAALGTMNFARTLVGTILIAIFGAVVLAKVPVGAAGDTLGQGCLGGYFGGRPSRPCSSPSPARSPSAFLSLILLEEKPLEANASRLAPLDATTRPLAPGAVEGTLRLAGESLLGLEKSKTLRK